jgi:hypothetical protein
VIFVVSIGKLPLERSAQNAVILGIVAQGAYLLDEMFFIFFIYRGCAISHFHIPDPGQALDAAASKSVRSARDNVTVL